MLISSRLNLHYYPEDDKLEYIKRGIDFMRESGFDAADLPMHLLPPEDVDVIDFMGRVKEHSQSIGMPIRVTHLPFSLRISKEPDYMPVFNKLMYRAIDGAATLGVDCAVLHPNAITEPLESYNEQRTRDAVLRHIAPFAEYADKLGVRLALENMGVIREDYPTHRFCQTPEELCGVADELGVGVCWDFGHANMGGLKQSEALSYVGKRLLTLHVNDNDGIGDDHVPITEGTIDWRDAMQGLANIGYNGLFNYEISTTNVPAEARCEFASGLLNSARVLVGYLEEARREY